MTIKLTKLRAQILNRMRDGWEMGMAPKLRLGTSYWIQRNGVGRGGETQRFNSSTFEYFLSNKLIELKAKRYPTSIYQLAPLGHDIVKQLNDQLKKSNHAKR